MQGMQNTREWNWSLVLKATFLGSVGGAAAGLGTALLVQGIHNLSDAALGTAAGAVGGAFIGVFAGMCWAQRNAREKIHYHSSYQESAYSIL